MSMTLAFDGPIWFWKGPAPFFFVTVPEAESQQLKAISGLVTYGWGVLPAQVRIGTTTWTMSLIPKADAYLVPIRASIRAAEQLAEGDTVRIELVL